MTTVDMEGCEVSIEVYDRADSTTPLIAMTRFTGQSINVSLDEDEGETRVGLLVRPAFVDGSDLDLRLTGYMEHAVLLKHVDDEVVVNVRISRCHVGRLLKVLGIEGQCKGETA